MRFVGPLTLLKMSFGGEWCKSLTLLLWKCILGNIGND